MYTKCMCMSAFPDALNCYMAQLFLKCRRTHEDAGAHMETALHNLPGANLKTRMQTQTHTWRHSLTLSSCLFHDKVAQLSVPSHLAASQSHLVANQSHLVSSQSCLVTSPSHLVASQPHLVASQPYLVASQSHLVTSQSHLVATQSHLVASQAI